MKYFNLLDWAMKYQKKFRGSVLWELDYTVETVVLLSKLKSDKHINIELDMYELGCCGEQSYL